MKKYYKNDLKNVQLYSLCTDVQKFTVLNIKNMCNVQG